jgi:hypothetical protein
MALTLGFRLSTTMPCEDEQNRRPPAHRNRHVLLQFSMHSHNQPDAPMRDATHSLGWKTRGAAAVFGMFTWAGADGAEETARIKIATAILAQPASQVALRIQFEHPAAVPQTSFVRFHGLPTSVSLTEGFSVGPGVWAVPLIGLATLKANVPVGVSGQTNFLITLVNVEGMILAEATSALVVESATDRQGAGTTTEHNALTYRPAALHPPVLPLAELPDPHIENLLAAGQRYLAQGNVAAARAFFRRAAEAGVAAGATLLATTYDPVGLKRLNVVGLVGDRNEALRWYERARELGAPDDPFRVTGCKC